MIRTSSLSARRPGPSQQNRSIAALAVLALILAAVVIVRREDYRLVVMGARLGGEAVAFQFVTWPVLAAAGLVLLWIVMSNLGEFLSA